MAEQRVAEEQYLEEFDPAKLIAKIKQDALDNAKEDSQDSSEQGA